VSRIIDSSSSRCEHHVDHADRGDRHPRQRRLRRLPAGPAFTNGGSTTPDPVLRAPRRSRLGAYGGIKNLLADRTNLLGPYNDARSARPRPARVQCRSSTATSASSKCVAAQPRVEHALHAQRQPRQFARSGEALLGDQPDRLHTDGEAILKPLHLSDGETRTSSRSAKPYRTTRRPYQRRRSRGLR